MPRVFLRRPAHVRLTGPLLVAPLVIGLAVAGCRSAGDNSGAGAAAHARGTSRAAPPHTIDHVVPSTPENLSWGWFPVDKAPVAFVKPGEVVEVHTLTGIGAEMPEGPVAGLVDMGVPADEVPEDLVAFWHTRGERPREGRDRHLLTGPIHVEGAQPGDVLEVQILEVRPRVPWGMNFTRARSGVMSTGHPGFREGDPALDIPPETEDMPPDAPVDEFHVIRTRTIDGRAHGVWDNGMRVPLAPFLGILAVAPDPRPGDAGVDVPGVQRSGPPGRFGGNLDLKHLTAGTSLYLPVLHVGARVYVGDPHGAQGDGEVSGTAIEQSMIAVLRFVVRKDMHLDGPRAETPTHHLILGMDTDLDRALRHATWNTVQFLVDGWGLRPSEAYSLTSVAVDFTISEAVDGVQVVTGMVPKAVLETVPARREAHPGAK